MNSSEPHVILTKKTELHYKYTRLLMAFSAFFISTICLLIPLFYQIITSNNFWKHIYILSFFIIGVYGYAFIFSFILAILIKEYGGRISVHYKKYESIYNLIFIAMVTAPLLVIFYIVFGIGAVGPVIGGIAMYAIKWWLDHKVQKQIT